MSYFFLEDEEAAVAVAMVELVDVVAEMPACVRSESS